MASLTEFTTIFVTSWLFIILACVIKVKLGDMTAGKVVSGVIAIVGAILLVYSWTIFSAYLL